MANEEVQLGDQPGDKYDDIWGPGGEAPGGGWYGGGGPGGGGGSGVPNPFIQGFGGQAQGWGGFGAQSSFAPGAMRRRRLMGGRSGTMAPFGAGQTRMDGNSAGMQSAGPQAGGFLGGAPGGAGILQWLQQGGGMPQAGGAGNPQNAHDLVGRIIGNAYAGGDGAFGMNPPPGILAAIRGQAVQDAGAREQAARRGLQTRGDTDPSTYGFQALMSQLQGQDQTARTMSQADLAMRQQQLQFLQSLLGQYMGNNTALEGQNRQSRAAWESSGGRSGLGQAAQMGGALFGGGGWPFGGGAGRGPSEAWMDPGYAPLPERR